MSQYLNYARWDNITDSDSDGEPRAGAPQTGNSSWLNDPHVQENIYPEHVRREADDDAIESALAVSPITSYPGMVQAMRILCVRDKKTVPFYPVFITVDHPLFRYPVTPLSIALGIPLAIRKEGPANAHLPDSSGNANRIATFLNIELENGFAPVFE